MLYRSTQRLRRAGASMKNLAHVPSLSMADSVPSYIGTEHLEIGEFPNVLPSCQILPGQLNIGIYVTSLTPSSPSQARLQGAILDGIGRLATGRYRFIVFSHEVPESFKDSSGVAYQALEREGRWGRAALHFKPLVGRLLLLICNLTGAGGGRLSNRIARWMRAEPKYYDQLRKLNVRLLWNMNQHELRTELPYIRTIWEANHRIHSMYPEYSYSRFTFDGLDVNMAYSLARASYVIVGTQEGRRQVITMFGVHADKVRVVPFPTPELPIPQKDSLRSNGTVAPTRYLFYPARFWPHKNHVVILSALRILQREHDIELACIFSGADEGNLGYVMRYAEQLGVKQQVEHVGLVSEEELASLYAGAFALVYASAVGPDNLPPLEAMSLGCPVITAQVPGAKEQYGDAALYFDPVDEHVLAQRILELNGDSALRDQLICRGRARAARVTVKDYAEKVTSILDEFAVVARSWERCDSAFT
jgi:glycosyltransferase involved in cell wall biosynthesis